MARDPERIDRIIALLWTYWKLNPDLRLGQMVMNLSPTNGSGEKITYHVEDHTLEQELMGIMDANVEVASDNRQVARHADI